MFRAEDMRLPATWGKVNPATAPADVRNLIRFNGPTPELSDVQQAKQHIAMYYANLTQMDDAMGQVLTALRELDLEKDTIVLYTSDHGELLGDHGLWQKFQFYEGSCGVPLLMRAPGVTTAGSKCGMPVSQVQLLPTLAELCGVSIPTLDGPSLLPQLRDVTAVRDLPVFAEFDLETPRAKYMLRRNDFKYTFRVNDVAELFDMRRDPEEMTNLALDPAHRERVGQMKQELFSWYTPPEISPARR
jgi:choline-sulfatase